MGNKHIEAWISGVSYERKIKVKMKDVLLLLMNKRNKINKGDKQQKMIVVGVTLTYHFTSPETKSIRIGFHGRHSHRMAF